MRLIRIVAVVEASCAPRDMASSRGFNSFIPSSSSLFRVFCFASLGDSRSIDPRGLDVLRVVIFHLDRFLEETHLRPRRLNDP